MALKLLPTLNHVNGQSMPFRLGPAGPGNQNWHELHPKIACHGELHQSMASHRELHQSLACHDELHQFNTFLSRVV